MDFMECPSEHRTHESLQHMSSVLQTLKVIGEGKILSLNSSNISHWPFSRVIFLLRGNILGTIQKYVIIL